MYINLKNWKLTFAVLQNKLRRVYDENKADL